MKVKEFREKYLNYVHYHSDRSFMEKYADAELIAYAATGFRYGKNNGKRFSTIMIFRTARLLLAFVNGHRRDDLAEVLDMLHGMETNTDLTNLEEVKRLAFLKAV